MFLKLLLPEIENFLKININFWTNIYFFYTFGPRDSCQLRWESISWIWIDRNVLIIDILLIVSVVGLFTGCTGVVKSG